MHIDHAALYGHDLEAARAFFETYLDATPGERYRGPRTTGDGYYESCVAGVEGALIELTV